MFFGVGESQFYLRSADNDYKFLLNRRFMIKASLSHCKSAGQLLSKKQNSEILTRDEIQGGKIVQKVYLKKYKYDTRDILGKGYSSIVYKATSIINPKLKFAIKVIELEEYNNLDLLEMEIETLLSIKHPHILQCLDVIKTEVKYYLVMEYCPHGDLEELIKFQKFIPEDRAISIMTQILDGYKALLAKNIIHRDLKPANIMRFGNNWKIGDFGFARFCKEEFLLEKIHVGTPLYLPLESLKLNKYSVKSDIFSLGVIFHEMLFGTTPWPCKTEEELIRAMEKKQQLQIPEGVICSQSEDFIRRCLKLQFYQRMSKQELKKFTFDKVDLEQLIKKRLPRGVSPAVKRSNSRSMNKSKMSSDKKELKSLKSEKSSYKGDEYYLSTPRINRNCQIPRSQNSDNSKSTLTKQSKRNYKKQAINEYFIAVPTPKKKYSQTK